MKKSFNFPKVKGETLIQNKTNMINKDEKVNQNMPQKQKTV